MEGVLVRVREAQRRDIAPEEGHDIVGLERTACNVFPVTAFETDSGVLLKECFGSS